MLAERHRARLAMQEGEVNAVTETRRGHSRVARRLFQDNEDENRDENHTLFVSDGREDRRYPGVRDNLTNRLSEESRQNLAKAEARWNFDFVNEKPLPGRWDWVKVENNQNLDNDENLMKNKKEIDTDEREKSETEANEKNDDKK